MSTYEYYRHNDSVRRCEDSHSIVMGYIAWIFGFMGAHRFYYGKQVSGVLWFFTLGLFFVGWIIDLFLIPRMQRESEYRYRTGSTNYSLAWLLLYVLGLFGVHRMYMGKWLTGILYLCTLGLLGLGWLYDLCTLNDQIDETAIISSW